MGPTGWGTLLKLRIPFGPSGRPAVTRIENTKRNSGRLGASGCRLFPESTELRV